MTLIFCSTCSPSLVEHFWYPYHGVMMSRTFSTGLWISKNTQKQGGPPQLNHVKINIFLLSNLKISIKIHTKIAFPLIKIVRGLIWSCTFLQRVPLIMSNMLDTHIMLRWHLDRSVEDFKKDFSNCKNTTFSVRIFKRFLHCLKTLWKSLLKKLYFCNLHNLI